QLEDRQVGDHAAGRHTVRLADGNATGSAAFRKLEAQTTLAGAGRGDDADHLAALARAALQRGLALLHLRIAPDELREAARQRDFEARAQLPEAFEGVHGEWLLRALDREIPERSELHVAIDQTRRVRGDVREAGLGELLHALRQPDRVALC